ncbi:MAG TPA: hypothetical protein VNM45_12915 [Bacillus sp. (in: firmicutes)]|nr:hypothetical protein [Bacillus sp. (in: firmicutes)]
MKRLNGDELIQPSKRKPCRAQYFIPIIKEQAQTRVLNISHSEKIHVEISIDFNAFFRIRTYKITF